MRHSNSIKISEGTALAIHALEFLVSDETRTYCVKDMAPLLEASVAHLSKVMQRLSKAGYVKSGRGPKGGFTLARPTEKTSLLEIYELMEGPLQEGGCLLGFVKCPVGGCALSSFLSGINKQVRAFFSKTMIDDLKIKELKNEKNKKGN